MCVMLTLFPLTAQCLLVVSTQEPDLTWMKSPRSVCVMSVYVCACVSVCVVVYVWYVAGIVGNGRQT